jgi:hypothetical protein
MIELEQVIKADDPQLREVLERMLANDEDITARAAARLHSSIKAASSITRSAIRSELLWQYQERQAEYRKWRGRVGKQTSSNIAAAIEQKEHRIAELEASVQVLVASHLVMLRAVGAMGGFKKWAEFYDQYRDARDKLAALNALPNAVIAELNSDKRQR